MRITDKHRNVIRMLIEGDLSKSEIAENVKIARKTLYNWLENDDFKDALNEEIKERERMVKAKIGVLAYQAVLRQEKILNKGKSDLAAANVAKDVLDRAGYEKVSLITSDEAEAGGVIFMPEVGEIE